MMSCEELYRFFINMSGELEERKMSRQNFRDKLSGQLFELVFSSQPNMKKFRDQLSAPLRELASKYALETLRCFDRAASLAYSKSETTTILTLPGPISETESEKELNELINHIPDEDVEYLTKNHWDEYRHQKQHEDFIFSIFRKMKEVLVEYYEANIMELDGKYLRLLDGELYHLVACEFVQEYYEIEYRAMKPSGFSV